MFFVFFAILIGMASNSVAGPDTPQTPSEPEQVAADVPDDDLDYLDEDVDESTQIADPIYYWNKGVYHFNDKLYFWVLKPVATGYRAVVPTPARTGVKNFFHNIAVPIRFVNCLLQGKVGEAGQEVALFIVDTTWGILGIRSLAQKYPDEVKHAEEDFGQTLGLYGLGNGFYIVWPFLGPSSLRDSVGFAGDRFLNPVAYVEPLEVSLGITGVKTVNDVSFRIGDYESLKQAAIDPYDAIRDAYVQNRIKKVNE